MILGVSGCRPHKFAATYTADDYKIIRETISVIVFTLQPDACISGMALGVDTWFVEECIKRDIPYWAAVPCEKQECMWRYSDQLHYYDLLNKASRVIQVTDGAFSPRKMQARNEWVVDNSDQLLVIWNGMHGGTANCRRYAIQIQRPMLEFKYA